MESGNSWTRLKNCGNGKTIRYKYQKSDLGVDKNWPRALICLPCKLLLQMCQHRRPEHGNRAQPIKNRKRDQPFGVILQPARLEFVKEINLIQKKNSRAGPARSLCRGWRKPRINRKEKKAARGASWPPGRGGKNTCSRSKRLLQKKHAAGRYRSRPGY